MTDFRYKAVDKAGKPVTGVVQAEDERAAARAVQDMGYIPVRITTGPLPLSAQGSARHLFQGLTDWASSLFQRISPKDVMIFTQDLATLLRAGLPVDRALSIEMQAVENERLREVIASILDSVKGGSYLSDAMAQYPEIFPRLYVNMVKAGESGGIVGEVLTRLGEFLEEMIELRDYVKFALVYPIFLAVVGGLSIIILLVFVIPKFSVIFDDMGKALPMSTQILLSMSNAFRKWWFLIAGGIAAGLAWIRHYVQTPEGRERMDRLKLRMPLVGKLVQSMEVARFARTLGTLQESGVPMLQAIVLAKDVIGNKIMREALEGISERVKEGERFSAALGSTELFPQLAVQLITIGEETGKLGEMFLRIAESYEKMVRATVKRLISLLEPAMILVMGLVVGFIVISMLMAIFSVNELPF